MYAESNVTSCICHEHGICTLTNLSVCDVIQTRDRYRKSRYSLHTSDTQYALRSILSLFIINYTIRAVNHYAIYYSFVSILEYSPVNNCDEEVAINYTTSGNRSLSEFMNPADPRNAVSLVNELLLVTGLEEFISYRFTVAITTSAGSISSVESGCALTNPTGNNYNNN